MAAPVLFVTVFTVEGWLRPGYHPGSVFVSELSLGPRGWVQIANFLFTGALVLAFGSGLAGWLRSGPASAAGFALLQVIGAALMASGPLVTDPSAMFDQASTHGTVHGLFGAVVFGLAPVSCLVLSRRFRSDPAWRPLASWTLTAGLLLVGGIVALKISQYPRSRLFAWKGWVQRCMLVVFMSWLFAVAARLRALVRRSSGPASFPGSMAGAQGHG